ncbi:MAG: alpha/beta hydrolase fold protein, partial [Gammaproteobacteria bacterium]|nr:alpha/beta hydrolase fold protein [Gammaproteobacteria bacterium]
RPEHIVKFYQLLGGGLKDAGWQREHISQNRLAILPNLTHYEMGGCQLTAAADTAAL